MATLDGVEKKASYFRAILTQVLDDEEVCSYASVQDNASSGGSRVHGSKALARYGTVWCGLVGSAVGDHPLGPYPLCLCEDLHEKALCSGPAGAPMSE